MHPALHCWREELPSAFVRALAVLCGVATLSLACTWLAQPRAATPLHSAETAREWIEIERPFPAFALAIPEATDVTPSYAIRRHATGNGRLDIIALGSAGGPGPTLHVEVYRPGTEIFQVRDIQSEIGTRAGGIDPIAVKAEMDPVDTKFGAMHTATFQAGKEGARRCRAFMRAFGNPRLQMFGWFCQDGDNYIDRATLACALDRFTLLAAGGEAKVGALFAQAELQRSFCGQRNTLLAPTPKHSALWQALSARAQAH